MKVEELVIDGFKSYSVRTVITDWDPQFNAITGLNGSGKSNILDAICFVLGITSTTALRASNLQDLIYKKGTSGVTKASVTITFDNSDPDTSPVAYKNDRKISITRKVAVDQPNSASTKYLINGRKATQKEVANLLQSVQLNINDPNFLIMQGQITKMLNMKPKQILSLIEEAAGTKSYEAQRDSSEKIMRKKDAKLEAIKETRDLQVKPKLDELARQTEVVIEYKNKVNEKDKNAQMLYCYLYQAGLDTIMETKEPLRESTEKLEKCNESIEKYKSQIERLTAEINEIKEKNKSTSDSAKLKELEAQEQDLSNSITRLKTAMNSKIENIKEIKESIKLKEAEIQRNEHSFNNKKDKFSELQNNFLKEESNLRNFKEVLQRKEDLLSTLSTGISSKGSSDSGYTSQLREANKKLSETKTLIEQDKINIRHLESQCDTRKLEACKKEILNYENEISQRKQTVESIKNQLRVNGFDQTEYEKLKQEEKTLIEQLNSKNRYLQEFTRRDSRFDFTYSDPVPNFNHSSVKGLCGELFDLPDKNKTSSTALEVCAGFKLFNVVVDTEKTGSLLLQRGRLSKRVTFVPLNRISSKVVRPEILNEAKRIAPNKVELALNLVEYDNDVGKAIEYVFGNKLICNDPETAKKVTFNDKIRTGSITLDGDNYDPEGRLSGGSRRTSNSLINQFSRYKELKHDVDTIRNRLNEISKILRNMNQAASKNNDIQEQLVSEEYNIGLLERKLVESNAAIYIQNFEKNMEKIKELKQLIELNENNVNNIQHEISEINKDINEFNSDGSKKVRELKEEISRMTTELSAKEKNLTKKRSLFNEEKVRNEDLMSDIETWKADIAKLNEDLPEIENLVKEDDLLINKYQIELESIVEQIEIERETANGFIQELNQLSEHLEHTRKLLSESNSKHEKYLEESNYYKSCERQAVNDMKEAKKLFSWIENDVQRKNILEQYPNIDPEQCQQKINECEQKIMELRSKGADVNIIQQADMLKTHDASLEKKIKKIEKDKMKIQATITKLDQYLKTELNKTFEIVSKEFGETFELLLPGAYAKLIKTDTNGDITKGLEVKVRLGNVWKESLVELSGGQRSLVALALIMSLLQFRPAPMYILDEVDAALDLSHTQSIGHLIKTKFKGSQFIVVSLKEGMFTNANRLFKVTFQENTSVVTSNSN